MSEFFRYVSVSGGKDSTAVYIWAIKQFGKDGFRAVFADTGHEHPVTINYVKNMHVFFNGPEVEIVKADFRDRMKKKMESSKAFNERAEANGWISKKGKKIKPGRKTHEHFNRTYSGSNYSNSAP